VNKPAPDAPRVLHKLYAYLHSYFWLPCPVCGKEFGGHEWNKGTLMTAHDRGVGTCDDCADSPEVKEALERFCGKRGAP